MSREKGLPQDEKDAAARTVDQRKRMRLKTGCSVDHGGDLCAACVERTLDGEGDRLAKVWAEQERETEQAAEKITERQSEAARAGRPKTSLPVPQEAVVLIREVLEKSGRLHHLTLIEDGVLIAVAPDCRFALYVKGLPA